MRSPHARSRLRIAAASKPIFWSLSAHTPTLASVCFFSARCSSLQRSSRPTSTTDGAEAPLLPRPSSYPNFRCALLGLLQHYKLALEQPGRLSLPGDEGP